MRHELGFHQLVVVIHSRPRHVFALVRFDGSTTYTAEEEAEDHRTRAEGSHVNHFQVGSEQSPRVRAIATTEVSKMREVARSVLFSRIMFASFGPTSPYAATNSLPQELLSRCRSGKRYVSMLARHLLYKF